MNVSALQPLLADADAAIQQLQTAWLDWPGVGTAIAAAAIDKAAQRPSTAARLSSDDSPDALSVAIREDLAKRARAVHAAVDGLREKLVDTLRTLHKSLPLGDSDSPRLDELKLTPLPGSEFQSAWSDEFRSSRVLSILAPLAAWSTRRRLERLAGNSVAEVMHLYDQQLKSWAKTNTARLAEFYLHQAEVCREQLRRLNSPADDNVGESSKCTELDADLMQLLAADTAASAERCRTA